MKNKYYDRYELNKIIDLFKTNIYIAKTRLESYMKKYPKDYSCYTLYVLILSTIGEIDKANIYWDKAYECYINGLVKEGKFKKLFEKNLLLGKLKLLSLEERYQELYDMCMKYQNELYQMRSIYFVYYAKSKLGLIDEDRAKYENATYILRQIVEYSYDDFLNNLNKHRLNDEYMPNKSYFSPDIDINSLLSEIKKYLPNDRRIYSGLFDNTYYFKLNDVGMYNNQICDYIKVVCFHNTKDIIALLPEVDNHNFDYIDINYINRNKDSKVKTLSQIDKFNKRYSK